VLWQAAGIAPVTSGRRDADGYYSIMDRKDMMIIGGENAYFIEVERALAADDLRVRHRPPVPV
jgi:acyl-CoA synthetase (AMP-forming)/AMP-acid ligase II